ncbi:Probable RNA-directed DNA polymerase from transposon BS [Eumeta japonica]|uniref:Probable RNA-directed DNA polymerase from transposon BS n=1 Tax=Eumeta variegata TaxID=151549 RepID=A0A4C1YCT4_EUMVA|nr:Probable RNA-directed DNA polymerase from transposon BS [Eumeta japonica]
MRNFLQRTVGLWYNLPSVVFPTKFDKEAFKKKEIPIQQTGNVQVIPLRCSWAATLRMSKNGGDHLHSDGPHAQALEEDRKLKAVIRGLSANIETDEIMMDLINQEYPVHTVHLRLHIKDGTARGPVLLVLSKFEKPRCVKCLVPDRTKECTHTKDLEDKLACLYTRTIQPITANARKPPKPNLKQPSTVLREIGYHAPQSFSRNFLALCGKNTAKYVGGDFHPTPAPATNPWLRNQPPRAAPQPPKEATRRGLPPSRPQTQQQRPSKNTSNRDVRPLNGTEVGDIGVHPQFPRMLERRGQADGALTNHIRTVIVNNLREVPASSDHWKFPADVHELIRAKNAPLHGTGAYITVEYKYRARAFQRRVRYIIPILSRFPSAWHFTHIPYRERGPAQSLPRPQRRSASRLSQRVTKVVKNLKIRKVPSLDSFNNKALTCFSLPLVSLLVAIFNACLKNCYFPPIWKEEIMEIQKPGKPRDLPTNYRPISLLSSIGKLYKKILKSCLSHHLLEKGLIIDEQFSFCAVHKKTHSTRRLIRVGVPQVPPPSRPILYSAYTSDIPHPISGVQLALLGDDTALYFRVRYKKSILLHLQRATDELEILTSKIILSALGKLHYSTEGVSAPCSVGTANYHCAISAQFAEWKNVLGCESAMSKNRLDASIKIPPLTSHPNPIHCRS